MSEYVYSRYAVIKNYEESFLNTVDDAFERTAPKYGDYTADAVEGVFRTVGNTNTSSAIFGFYVSDSSEASTFNASKTIGKYLAKMKEGSYFAVKSADIYQLVAHYYRGTYIDDIIADEGQYPLDGRSGDYWYVRGEKYSRLPSVHADGEWAELAEGFVTVDGQRRNITETFIKVDGVWKTLA